MSIFNKKLGPFGLSIQSGGNSTKSNISRLICATLLAGFVSVCGSARAYTTNVLVNPGAEAGLTGWNLSLTPYIYAVSTNAQIGGGSTNNILAHSGTNVFEIFNTTGNSTFMYQDYPAIAGSLWTANGYAISYASNYLSPSTSAQIQAAFYDISNNLLPYATNGVTAAIGGTYTSDFLVFDGSVTNEGVPAIVPPLAVDATGWVYLEATNLNDDNPADVGGVDTTVVNYPLVAPPGTAKIRYEVYLVNTVATGGAVYWDDLALNKLNLTDPDITNQPVAETVFAGLPASFSVGAWHTGAHPGEKFTYQWMYNGTNLPAGGGVNNISTLTTSPTLSFTNCSASASGLYSVLVTVKSSDGYSNSILSVPVPLTVLVLSPIQKANVLGPNAGFENNPVWAPWSIFNGIQFATAASFYDFAGAATDPVNVFDGTSCAWVGDNGDRDNGFYAQFAASPGSLWKAGGYAYVSTTNDFVQGNTCRLQIWFLNSLGGAATPGTPTYESFKIYGLGYTNADAQYVDINTNSPTYGQTLYHTQLPRDQWVSMPVTNEVNNGGIGLADDLPYATLPTGYFTVPTNSTAINFQVYEYCPVAADNPQADLTGAALDSVYWDDMTLIQVAPVTNLTATVSGGNVNLSFNAGAGLNYAVLYKTNLTDSSWNTLTTVAAPMTWQTNTTVLTTQYPLTVTDSVSGQHSRFYKVQSQ